MADPSEKAASSRPGSGTFLAGLIAVGFLLAGWTGYETFRPRPVDEPIHQQAKDLLREYKPVPLSGELDKLLDNPTAFYVKSLDLPLIGTTAPDFELNDWQGRSVKLSRLLREGPVLLVFYYGYWCDHCVVQLFDIHEDLRHFRQLGVNVIAVSADPPSETAAKFKQFGKFDFDVLSDPGNEVARLYSCYDPPREGAEEKQFHGSFVIRQDGTIVWGDIAEQPFRSNRTLLYEFVKLNAGKTDESKAGR